MKRLATMAVVVLVVVLAVGAVSASRGDRSQANLVAGTNCPAETANLLAAQSVPSASLVPCVALFGGRWSVETETYTDDGTSVSMIGEDAPDIRWKVELDASCDSSGLSAQGASGDATTFENSAETGSTFEREQMLVFEGGCVTSTLKTPLRFDRGIVLEDVDAALVLVERAALDAEVREQTDGKLGLDP